jgi:hypothetical protein
VLIERHAVVVLAMQYRAGGHDGQPVSRRLPAPVDDVRVAVLADGDQIGEREVG